jgi:hypothetical protein
MTEENKPQEQKKEVKPAAQEPKKVAPADAAAAAPVAAPDSAKKKNKKISQMDLKEVEEALNLVRQKMGRLDSRYAIELLKRKEALAKK